MSSIKLEIFTFHLKKTDFCIEIYTDKLTTFVNYKWFQTRGTTLLPYQYCILIKVVVLNSKLLQIKKKRNKNSLESILFRK